MSLTIAYISNRKECHLEWFFDSLALQFKHDFPLKIIVVNHHFQLQEPFRENADENSSYKVMTLEACNKAGLGEITLFCEPKPNVWSGRYRLTKENWFCASNFRNTAFCRCNTEWIAYIDDVSVLCPGWLDAVREAMDARRITCGTYQKVKNLVVENGVIKSFTEFPEGMDSRPKYTNGVNPFIHSGEWLFGCSVLLPTQVLVEVGGWPEFADGMGMEDVLLGKALDNRGHIIYFDQRMKTLESEEHHYLEKPWIRSDYGVSPNDKSHAALHAVTSGMKYFENYNEGGIPRVRREVLAGNPFPVTQIPEHEWYTKTPLRDLEPSKK